MCIRDRVWTERINALLPYQVNKKVMDNADTVSYTHLVLLLVVGTFMDVTPAILIFTPILLPICKSFGMDPIHFGILLCFRCV